MRFTLHRRAATVDIDTDFRADVAVWRPSNGQWWYRPSGNPSGPIAVAFGQSGDKPLAGDYDGDRSTDQAVYRSGTWYLQQSTGGFQVVSFGLADDKPVPGDCDADGATEMAVYRPPVPAQAGPQPRGEWLIAGRPSPLSFGEPGKEPVLLASP